MSLGIANRTTTVVVSDEDVLSAMDSLGINQYSLYLRLFMSDYREMAYNVMMKRLGLLKGDNGLLAIDWTDSKNSPENATYDQDAVSIRE